MIVTIDGPAGGGKSTAARNLARRLGIPYLDTGAMYRALTLKSRRTGSPVESLLGSTRIDIDGRDGKLRVSLDGADVTDAIRTPEVTAGVSATAKVPQVREWMVRAQREAAAALGDVVTEGRDQGSVVFPDADVKFYMTADLATRAHRRRDEFGEAGRSQDLSEVMEAIRLRDLADSTRETAPLRRPEGSILIDTTQLDADGTVEALIGHIRRVTGRPPCSKDSSTNCADASPGSPPPSPTASG